MKKKIFGIIVSMLMIATLFSVVTAEKNTNSTGASQSASTSDNYRFDLWNQSYFSDANYTQGNSVKQTSDGGYIIVGFVQDSATGLNHMRILKTDATGNKTWDKIFPRESQGRSVKQTNDGGYIITGSVYSAETIITSVLLLKTDANGNEVWNKTIDGNNGGIDVLQISDSGYVVLAGNTPWVGDNDPLLIRTAANGTVLWVKTTTEGYYEESGSNVQQTSDGGFIVVGTRISLSTTKRCVLLYKTLENGTEEWAQSFAQTASRDQWGTAVRQTADGGYILVGTKVINDDGIVDALLIKTNASGGIKSQKTFDDPNHMNNWGYGLEIMKDGGYLILSSIETDSIWFIKTDVLSNKQWDVTYNPVDGTYVIGYDLAQTNDNGYIVTGFINPGAVFLLKINGAPNIPSIPSGPSLLKTGQNGVFTTNATDLQGDQVYYKFSWGTTESGWIGPFASGATGSASHNWTTSGTYQVKAKAKDQYFESNWSQPKTVTVTIPNLEIKAITGGFGVSVVIRNNGTAAATNFIGEINVTGGILNLVKKDVKSTPTSLAVGEEKTVTSGLIVGFGKITIKVSAYCDEVPTPVQVSQDAKLFIVLVK
jgi:hypothetical protein